MKKLPNYFQHFDDHRTNNIFNAMRRSLDGKDYFANVAFEALKVIEHVDYELEIKCKTKSEAFRDLGNRYYQHGNTQKALIFYNKALTYAPHSSLAMKLAYSNRSAVLFSTRLYKACEKDCDTALAISCPTTPSVIAKLRKRKFQAASALEKPDELAHHNQKISKNADEIYKLKSYHPAIICASRDIDVIMESGVPKIVAKKNIPPGTLVALEKAFVSWAPYLSDEAYSCYHCRKLDVNLFPCAGCVVGLFCSKECQENSMAEYHSVECQIIGNMLHIETQDRWIIKAMLKMRNMCASWNDLIDMSQKFGLDRMKRDTLTEIFDGRKPTSLLSFYNDRHFIYGALYQKSYICALFLCNLRQLPAYFPTDTESKISAMKALANIMMYCSLYIRTSNLNLTVDFRESNKVGPHIHSHRGLFPFIGKLTHACVPNLQSVTLNDSIALFSQKNIKAGAELTVTHVPHWLEKEMTKKERQEYMVIKHLSCCNCFVCKPTSIEWQKLKNIIALPQHLKTSIVDCLEIEKRLAIGIPVKDCLDLMYLVIADLQHIPISAHYESVYKRLCCVHAYILSKKFENTMLGHDG